MKLPGTYAAYYWTTRLLFLDDVGCSKQGNILEFSAPAGSISATVDPAGASHPASGWDGVSGFSAANRLLPTEGADVPERMN